MGSEEWGVGCGVWGVGRGAWGVGRGRGGWGMCAVCPGGAGGRAHVVSPPEVPHQRPFPMPFKRRPRMCAHVHEGRRAWGVGRGAWAWAWGVGGGVCVLFVLVGLGGEHT